MFRFKRTQQKLKSQFKLKKKKILKPFNLYYNIRLPSNYPFKHLFLQKTNKLLSSKYGYTLDEYKYAVHYTL